MATTQGIKLDDTTRQRLKALGEVRKRTPHWLMRTAIEDYLEREERYECELAEDMKRWEEYLRTGEAYSQDEVVKWFANYTRKKSAKPVKTVKHR